jgi:hypothetical protein
MSWVLVDFRHRSFASKDSACGRKVCGGNREWFPFSAGDFHCLIIEIYVKPSESVQGGGISTCVPSKLEHLRHQHCVPTGSMARPAIVSVADNADGRMPIAIGVAIIL